MLIYCDDKYDLDLIFFIHSALSLVVASLWRELFYRSQLDFPNIVLHFQMLWLFPKYRWTWLFRGLSQSQLLCNLKVVPSELQFESLFNIVALCRKVTYHQSGQIYPESSWKRLLVEWRADYSLTLALTKSLMETISLEIWIWSSFTGSLLWP